MTDNLYFCDELNDTLTCFHDKITSCCSSPNGPVYIQDYNGKKFDFEILKQKKLEFFSLFNEENIKDSPCYGCFSLRKRTPKDLITTKYKMLHVSHWTHCNCGCIYCVYTHDDETKKIYYNTRKTYDIKPIWENLREKNLISSDLVLLIGGGECTEFSKGELEWLIYFSTFYKGKIQILSSGINYSKAIESILKSGSVELCISPDAGTKKVYERIKRVKAFEQVWENLNNYIIAAQNNPKARIEVKYIIIPGVNDYKKEVMEFIKKCRKINCKNIHVDIEHYWYAENRNKPVPSNIKKLINIFRRNEEFSVSFSAETENWLINL